jgi:hypothetical protein
MSKLYLSVRADTNDADYVSSFREITPELLEKIKPILTEIKNCKNVYNFPTGDHAIGEVHAEEMYVKDRGVSQHVFNAFSGYVPSAEFGIHTIDKVIVYEVASEEKLI